MRDLIDDPDFRLGLADMRGPGIGVAIWGLVTGVAMAQSLGAPLALALTLTVYAGSAQLAALPLIAASAPLWVVLATAACVNLRFVVFSAQMRPYLERLRLGGRLLAGYLIGDVCVVVALRRHPVPDGSAGQLRHYLGAATANWLLWQAGSLAGIVAAEGFPASWGVAFAGILALFAVVVGLLADRSLASAVVVASTVATLLFWLPLKLNLVAAVACAIAAGATWDALHRRTAGHRREPGS